MSESLLDGPLRMIVQVSGMVFYSTATLKHQLNMQNWTGFEWRDAPLK